MRKTLSGQDFCAMIEGGSAAIAIEKQHINDLNVFPVPDGDTGTNMTLTMGASVAELRKKCPTTVGQAAEVTASALLRGARGNSGVILSLLFRGISKGLKDKEEADAKTLAQAMVDGVDAAYKAVMKPAEGTMLTVSRVASAAAVEYAAKEPDIELLFAHTLAIGYEALAQTIDQNPVLKKAGVVDAGGKGYLIILEGMLAALKGEAIGKPETTAAATAVVAQTAAVDPASFSHEEITFTYCTEFLIYRENQNDISDFRSLLDGIGDSLVVVDDEAVVKVHIHTDDPGRVLTEAKAFGSLHSIKIDNMREQAAEFGGGTENQSPPAEPELPSELDKPYVAPAEKPVGIVAVSAGEGMASIFVDLGVDQIVTGGQTMNPCTDEIVRAIDRVPAETVYVLPNNKNIILAAQQAAPLAQKKVVIIPTKTIPQGVATLLVFDPEAEVEDNVAAMEDCIKRVKTAQITYAARDSDFDNHQITAGEYLALFDSTLLGHAAEFGTVLQTTIDAIAARNPEFVTLFYGENVDEATATRCAEAISAQIPNAEITVLNGGQPVYYFMISVE